jgi:hypothetical protein
MRVAKVFKEVQAVRRRCSGAMRRKLRCWAMTSQDAGFRLRCKIVLNLLRGESTQRISEVLACSLSQVYRIAHRFVEEGEIGLADRREPTCLSSNSGSWWDATTQRPNASTSFWTTTPFTAANVHKSPWRPRATESICISCRPTVRAIIESSVCGATCTTTSPGITAAEPCVN